MFLEKGAEAWMNRDGVKLFPYDEVTLRGGQGDKRLKFLCL
jgi:hypothetical protein